MLTVNYYIILDQSCFNRNTNTNGICVLVSNCPSALHKDLNFRTDISYCGRVNDDWYACCTDTEVLYKKQLEESNNTNILNRFVSNRKSIQSEYTKYTRNR